MRGSRVTCEGSTARWKQMFMFHVEHRRIGSWARHGSPGLATESEVVARSTDLTLYSRAVPHVLAIANQKGGVGKTTTAVNLAASLAVAEQRTLLIDGDPQGNATSGIGLARDALGATVYDLLIGGATAAEARHRALAPIASEYDYILIDCPPSLGLITINMLAAADALLIPVQCEYYALEGLSQLLNTVHLVQQSVNELLSIDGVLLTMFDGRLNLSRQVAADAREYFGPKVYNNVIPRNVRLAEAPSFGKPIILYDVTSVGAQAYMAVAREMLERHRSASAAAARRASAGGRGASGARERAAPAGAPADRMRDEALRQRGGEGPSASGLPTGGDDESGDFVPRV